MLLVLVERGVAANCVAKPFKWYCILKKDAHFIVLDVPTQVKLAIIKENTLDMYFSLCLGVESGMGDRTLAQRRDGLSKNTSMQLYRVK